MVHRIERRTISHAGEKENFKNMAKKERKESLMRGTFYQHTSFLDHKFMHLWLFLQAKGTLRLVNYLERQVTCLVYQIKTTVLVPFVKRGEHLLSSSNITRNGSRKLNYLLPSIKFHALLLCWFILEKLLPYNNKFPSSVHDHHSANFNWIWQ